MQSGLFQPQRLTRSVIQVIMRDLMELGFKKYGNRPLPPFPWVGAKPTEVGKDAHSFS